MDRCSATSLQLADRRLERAIHVPQRLERDMDHVAVRLVVEHLIAPKRLRVLYLDQHVSAPSRAVRLVVLHAAVDDVTPIPRSGERLEALAPCLVELSFSDALGVDETLEIHLAHRSPPLLRRASAHGRLATLSELQHGRTSR